MTLPKISLEKLTQFFNGRSPREKIIMIGAGVCFVVLVDFALILQPLGAKLFSVQPQLQALGKEAKELKQDRKDKEKIESEWKAIHEQIAGLDQRFALSSEASAENLSVMARESGVKILSLAPVEKPKGGAAASSSGQTGIKIDASAGAHALGKFLAKIETSPLFFRVTHLTIRENAGDVKNHLIEMSVECYRKI